MSTVASGTVKNILVAQATTVVNERPLGEAAYPGHVVFENSLVKFMKQASAGVAVQVQVLVEDDLQGRAVSTVYASAAIARAAVLRSGDRFNARLVASYTGKHGDYLAVAAGGRVDAVASGIPLFKALEAVTASSADDFILVEVI